MQGERMYLSRFIRKEREEKRNNDISLGMILSSFFTPEVQV